MIIVPQEFHDKANGQIIHPIAGLYISFDKQLAGGVDFFTLDESILDGVDILDSDNHEAIQLWDRYDYKDYSDRLVSMNLSRSFEFPYTVQSAIADFTVNNYDDLFTPDYKESPLSEYNLPARPLRLYAGFNGLTQVAQFVGITEDMPDINIQSKTADYHAMDFLTQIADQTLNQVVDMRNVTTDEVLEQIVKQFGLIETQYQFEHGSNVIPFVFFDIGQNAGEAIRHLVQAEGGKMWLDENGILRFQARSFGDNWRQEYQEVEYIESNGSQYIDTGITGNINTRASVKFMQVKESTRKTCIPLGHYYYNNANILLTLKTDGSDSSIYFGNIQIQPNIDVELNTINNVSIDKNNFYINGEGYAIGCETQFSTNSSLVLFRRTDLTSAYNNGTMRIYSCTIMDGEEIVSNLVPCVRKSDEVAGMYDTVSRRFITNSGTGSFVTGPVTGFNPGTFNLSPYSIIDIKPSGTSDMVNHLIINAEVREVQEFQYVYTKTKPKNDSVTPEWVIPANSTMTVSCSLEDPCYDVVNPVLGQTADVSWFTLRKDDLTPVTTGVTATGTLTNNSYDIEFENTNGFGVEINELQLYGEPAKVTNYVEVDAKEDDSYLKYGDHLLEITDNEFFQNQVQAETFSRYLLFEYAFYNVSLEIQIKGDFSMQLGDIVTIQDPIYGGAYIIDGLEYEISSGYMTTVLNVHKYVTPNYFTLDEDILNGEAVLA